MAFEQRTNAFYWEPLLDAQGKQIGIRLQVDVWEGDDRDRPGQVLVGQTTADILFPAGSKEIDDATIEQAKKQARMVIVGNRKKRFD